MSRAKILILLSLISEISANDCGKSKISSGLSIGGEYSSLGQWPWLASIFLNEKYICGSSIISERFLLAAAHCVQPKGNLPYPPEDFHAYLGQFNLSNKNEPNSVQVKFSEIIVHDDWILNLFQLTFDADIALFKMTSAIEFTDYIQPICLPPADAKVFDVNGIVVGYGISETAKLHENLQKHVKIKSVDHGVCFFRQRENFRYGSLRMFCAGEKGKNPCRGDSGGPFMVEENNKWSINGIVSVAAETKCEDNDFVLFTQVPMFLEWIDSTMTEVPLHCDRFDNDVTDCFSESFKVLKPNLRVTSITLHNSLRYDDIEIIFIQDAQVHYLPDFSLANTKFPKLHQLTIIQCGLKELERKKLASMPRTTDLSLGKNQIEHLSEDVFDDVTDLKEIWIYENQIKNLPQKLLWKLQKLEKFIFYSNKVERVPENFFKNNENLRIVNLQNNQIAHIKIDLRTLPALRIFVLTSNKCTSSAFDTSGKKNRLKSLSEFQDIIDKKCS